MNRSSSRDFLLFSVLVVGGVAIRLFVETPNLSPVAALALFAGCMFRSLTVAACVPLLVMAISDRFIGGYALPMMLVVYSMLALPVVLRGVCGKLVAARTTQPTPTVSEAVTRLAGCGLLMSVAFYVVTNGAVWWMSSIYSHDMTGFMACYRNAIPFFRNTIMGDQLFTMALFGSHALVVLVARNGRRVFANSRLVVADKSAVSCRS